ncbi:MAG: B12-binding domain-containing radical SAM protein [Candidatus Aureabacteria bacterium]|nr:B12-binding domain-containing radical SAM protein [Candidatus Auribacterota bacterium]
MKIYVATILILSLSFVLCSAPDHLSPQSTLNHRNFDQLSFIHKGTPEDPIRVVFILPKDPEYKDKPTRLPIGLMSMASCLKDKMFLLVLCRSLGMDIQIEQLPEIEVSIIDLQAEGPDFDLKTRLRQTNPDLIGLSAVSPLYRHAEEIAELASTAAPEAIRVIGGVHISALNQNPSEFNLALKESPFHVAILKEGEEALSELILRIFRKEKTDNINGVVLNRDEDLIRNISDFPKSRRKRKVLLHEYPMPAESLDLINLSNYARGFSNFEGIPYDGTVGTLLTLRGCLGNCAYCASRVIFSKLEMHSPEQILREIQLYAEKGVTAFNIADDDFCVKLDRLEKLRDLLQKIKIPIQYTAMARADWINEEMVQTLKGTGCVGIAMGVETGDFTLLKKGMHKKLKLEKVASATRLLQQYGIQVKHFYMVGYPDQGWDSIKMTADNIIRNPPDLINVSITVPYPGTRLYQEGGIHPVLGMDLLTSKHEPAGRKKVSEAPTFQAGTYTNVMSTEEITLARNLLLTLFDAVKNKRNNEVDRLMFLLNELASGRWKKVTSIFSIIVLEMAA